jgi:hypothetical protein
VLAFAGYVSQSDKVKYYSSRIRSRLNHQRHQRHAGQRQHAAQMGALVVFVSTRGARLADNISHGYLPDPRNVACTAPARAGMSTQAPGPGELLAAMAGGDQRAR